VAEPAPGAARTRGEKLALSPAGSVPLASETAAWNPTSAATFTATAALAPAFVTMSPVARDLCYFK
jgi:hypothetical protein